MKVEWTNKDSLSIESTGQKAILVFDMPDDCMKCPCYRQIHDDGLFEDCKATLRPLSPAERDVVPEWCPLKPIPEKRNCGKKTSEAGKIFEAWCWGWDACIDAITGETE